MGQGFYHSPFNHINSSSPGFNTTSSGIFALESTGVREWQYPTNRVVRFASLGTDDAYIKFGTSDVTIGSTVGMLYLGGTVEIYRMLTPSITHIAIKSSTADFTANVVLGEGNP